MSDIDFCLEVLKKEDLKIVKEAVERTTWKKERGEWVDDMGYDIFVWLTECVPTHLNPLKYCTTVREMIEKEHKMDQQELKEMFFYGKNLAEMWDHINVKGSDFLIKITENFIKELKSKNINPTHKELDDYLKELKKNIEEL